MYAYAAWAQKVFTKTKRASVESAAFPAAAVTSLLGENPHIFIHFKCGLMKDRVLIT